MIGDKYFWDYKSARDVGVDALLIESDYSKDDIKDKKIKNTIKRLHEVLDFIN
jgi:FMN phosphatase YigB (HAD superfamily)